MEYLSNMFRKPWHKMHAAFLVLLNFNFSFFTRVLNISKLLSLKHGVSKTRGRGRGVFFNNIFSFIFFFLCFFFCFSTQIPISRNLCQQCIVTTFSHFLITFFFHFLFSMFFSFLFFNPNSDFSQFASAVHRYNIFGYKGNGNAVELIC